MIKITVLNDNRCEKENFECEYGLSLYIEYDQKKILFDAGQTDIFLRNAEKLGIDLVDLGAIVLSHGDYDHGNGLKYLNPKTKIKLICHPDFLKNRISKRTGKYDGLNQTKNELSEKFDLVLTKEPYRISENIIFLGEIERKNNFEKGANLPMVDGRGETYAHFDDSGIVLKTPRGIIVISGCAHSGICNTIAYAKEITNTQEVLAVIGGFHLKEINDQTTKTIKYFLENEIKNIYPMHCTSDLVCSEFLKEIPAHIKILSSGTRLKIDE